MPTGTTPRASATSWLPQLTVATRFGAAGISVVPNVLVSVTGKEPSEADVPAGSGPEAPHPLSASAAVAVTAAVRIVLRRRRTRVLSRVGKASLTKLRHASRGSSRGRRPRRVPLEGDRGLRRRSRRARAAAARRAGGGLPRAPRPPPPAARGRRR